MNNKKCVVEYAQFPCLGKSSKEKTNQEIFYQNSIQKEKENKEKEELLFELGDYLTNAQILYSRLEDLKKARYFFYSNKNSNEKIKYVKEMILEHSCNVGRIQAIKDLQRGLSILNKNRRNSLYEAKNILVEDGIFGGKTQAALENVCKNYSLNTIKKYILLGIFNNGVFKLKNESVLNEK